MSPNTLYHGQFVHSISLTELEYLVDALVYVADGAIAWIEKDVDGSLVQEIAARHGLTLDDPGLEVVSLEEGDFICPGLIDTHTVRPPLRDKE
jgi:guanine deaminase